MSQPLSHVSAAREFGDVEIVAVDHRRIAALRERHRAMLWLSMAILAAAFLLRERNTGHVGFALVPNANLPTLCGSRVLFNLDCPGCGLTRSFIALASGDLRASLLAHRVGWLVALAVALQIPYRLYTLRELRTLCRRDIPPRVWPIWCGYFLLATLVVNWLLRVSHLY